MKLRHLLILLFSALAQFGFSQTVGFEVRTINYTTQKKEAGVTVKVYDGSTVVHTGTTSGGGEHAFTVPSGKTYKVEVTKAGFVTKFVMLNVTNVDEELIQGSSSVNGNVQLSMVAEIPDVDFSYVSTNPTTTFTYDGKSPELKFDLAAGQKMQKEIEKIIKAGADADKQREAEFNEAMKAAAALEAQQKYAEAIKEYERAAYKKPSDKVAPAKIVELEGILKAKTNAANANAQLEADYASLITAANTLRDQGKHQDAIAKYQEALTKKQEQYPKDEIVKCNKAIADAKVAAENKAKYDAAMAAGNSFYTQKSWQAAKDKYKEALKAIPEDPTAKAKLADIEGKMNAVVEEQKKKAEYDKLVTEGDALMTAEKYEDAKAKYQASLAIISGSEYPTNKIKECDAKIAEIAAAKAKETQIAKLLEEGNTAFTAKQWAPSKLKYQEVLKLDAANAIAAGRITEIDAKIAEDIKNAAAIAEAKKLVTEGDALAKTGKNEDALAKYNAAQAKYNDPAVQPKIDAVNAAILAAKDKEAKKAAFDKAILDGDAALASKNYEGAKAKYNEAQTMDPASGIPKTKLAEVDKQIAAAGAAEKKAAFDKAIQEGDAALAANNFEEAKAKYNAAQTIDVASTLPKTKLAEVDKRIAANQAAADKAAKYTAEIAKGDAAMASKDYTVAKSAYAAAIAADPKEEAKAKLAAADKALADNLAVEQQKAKYTAAVQAGTDLMNAGKLTEAKAKFVEANKIDGTQSLPVDKIKEIDLALAGEAKKAEVAKLMTEGNTALAAKKYTDAKAKYQQILTIDATNAEATAKLADAIKGENEAIDGAAKEANFQKLKTEGIALMGQSKYVEAKTKLSEAKAIKADADVDKKIAECDAKLAEIAKGAEAGQKYTDAMNQAKALEAANKLDEAVAKYNEALSFKNEQEPKDRINAIKAIQQGQLDAAKLEENFKKAVKSGDDQVAAKDYAKAIAAYDQALAIKNDAGVAAKKADAQNQLALAQGSAKLEEDFKKAVKLGDDQVTAKDYAKAIAAYDQALAIKNDAGVAAKKADAQNQLTLAQGNAKVDEEFKKLVAAGDAAMSTTDYVTAMAKYDEALSKKSDPAVIAKKTEAERLNKEKGINDEEVQYQKILTAGQKAIDEKNYTRAKEMYNRALGIRSNDPIPTKKLKEIEDLMKAEADAKAKDAAYIAKITEAENNAKAGKLEAAIASFEQAKTIKPVETLPDTRIAELRAQIANVPNPQVELEKKYKAAMDAGNSLASAKDYNGAISKYQEALVVKPKDKPATDAIAEMRQILDNEALANKNKAEIDAMIVAADKLFAAENWQDAKTAYDKVLVKDPSRGYAKTQGDICQAKIDEATGQEKQKEYQKIIAVADKNFDATDYKKAKDYYQRAVNLVPTDPYPRKRLEDIENLMNPKPITNPPLLTQNNPEPLPSLGEVSTSPDDEDGGRLQLADQTKKQRNPRRMKALVDSTRIKSESYSNNQLETTTETNEAFTDLKIKNEKFSDSSDVYRQDNVAVIHGNDKEIEAGRIEDEEYETAGLQYANDQLTLINIEAEKTSSTMDTTAVNNAKVFTVQQTELEEKTNVLGDDDHNEDLHSDQKFKDFKLTQDKKSFDNYEERKATEGIVQDAYEKSVEVTEANTEKKTNDILVVEQTLTKTNNQVAEQMLEDVKQAPVNHEELKKIDDNQQELADIDSKEHMANTMTYKEILVKDEQVVIEQSENGLQQRLENRDKIDAVSVSKEEIDRTNYNGVYEKSLTNQGTLTAEIIKQDKYNELPSLVAESNGKVYQQLSTQGQTEAIATNAAQDEKHQTNQATLTKSNQNGEATSTKSAESSGDNAAAIKKTQESLGAVESKQVDDQKEKTLSSKSTLTAIETKEVVVADKPANDLGKMYAEGVTQEKFDQKDDEGLVTAVVTRRIVVKAGHGDVYIRTQTISATTYSKNGEPTTEAVWQKETTDAKLVKNN